MSTVVYCDICGRSCDRYHTITEDTDSASYSAAMVVRPLNNAALPVGVLNVCDARDSGDVGCVGFFREGLKSAKVQARAWLEENRPYALRNVVLPPR